MRRVVGGEVLLPNLEEESLHLRVLEAPGGGDALLEDASQLVRGERRKGLEESATYLGRPEQL